MVSEELWNVVEWWKSGLLVEWCVRDWKNLAMLVEWWNIMREGLLVLTCGMIVELRNCGMVE